MLNNRLSTFLESNSLLAEEQNGFRPKRSCEDHITTLLTVLLNRKANNQSTYVAFVDAQKPFDRVDRKYMLYKLLKIGVTGKLYRIIKSVYKSCDCCLDINGNYTEKFISNVGVRQGDTLSPTMFNTFTNDLPQEINSLGLGVPIGDGEYLSILLYADDIVLIASSENDLQKMLETTYNWGQNWGINFNCDKTKVIHFRKKQLLPQVTIFLWGQLY